MNNETVTLPLYLRVIAVLMAIVVIIGIFTSKVYEITEAGIVVAIILGIAEIRLGNRMRSTR